MKKIAVAKLKVTLKLEDTLPAFYVGLHTPHHDKEVALTATSFHIPHFVFTKIYQRFFKYIDRFSTYINDFFIISTLRHKISIYRQPSTLKTHNIPYPPSNLLPNSTIKKIINKIASIFNATYATLKTA